MEDRLLREPEVARVTSLGRTTRYEMEQRGEFPLRRRITNSISGWLESEILEFIRSRKVGVADAPVAALAARARARDKRAPRSG